MQIINKNYTIPNLDKQEIWRYLGRKNQEIDKKLDKIADEVIERVKKIAKPKSILMTGRISKDGDELSLFNIPLEGKAIKRFLIDSDEAALFAVTLGLDLDREIKRLEQTDLTKALIMDSTASTLVEEICNQVSDDFENFQKENNKYTTERFSPGYSDLPLKIQNDITRVLDTQRKIGLATTDSSLLLPRKSVTAIIGVLDKPRKPMSNRCSICLLRGNCKFGICQRSNQ